MVISGSLEEPSSSSQEGLWYASKKVNGAVVARVSNSMSNAHLAGSNRSGKTLLPGLFVLLPLLEDSLRDFDVLTAQAYPRVKGQISRVLPLDKVSSSDEPRRTGR